MPSLPAPGNIDPPLEHARAALRLLAARRIVPTPEAYRRAYEEVAGINEQASVQSMLADFAASCQTANPALAAIGAHIGGAVASGDWLQCGKHFAVLLAYLRQQPAPDIHAGERGIFKTFPTSAEQQAELLRNLYGRTLGIALVSLLQHAPVLAQQADALGQQIRDATSHATLDVATAQLRQLCFEIELLSGERAEQQELLLRLLRLLLDNMGELIDDDVWMREQIGVLRTLLSEPISHRVLDDAARNLKEIIYKQDVLKQGIAEARVQKIESQLSQMSAHVNQDPLTGCLNRRGLNDMLAREIARAERRNLPLCFAQLMLDDLSTGAVANDAAANDRVLIHFVRVARDTLRTMDIIGRLDGKTFLIVLPDTRLGNAGMVLKRLQGVLAERHFLHHEVPALLTLCAGVILRAPDEEQQAAMMRAADLLALAKKAGRNRLVLGQPDAG
jgi:diguanylate cyclase (GGDEF)-like protein